MTLRLQTIAAAVKAINGPLRRVSAVISTENPDRSGDIVRSRGCDSANFMASGSGTVLWNHDQDQVIARAITLDVEASRVTSVAEFPPPGISAKADEVYGLIKANLVNSASIGFIPKKVKPAEKQRGLDISEWELLEWSFVSVPANADAAIILRSLHADLKAGRSYSEDEEEEYHRDVLRRRLRLCELRSLS